MQYLTPNLKKEIIKLSNLKPEIETGGVLVKKKKRLFPIQCENQSPMPKEHFLVLPNQIDALKKTGDIVALWHSHTDDDHLLSDGDKLMSEKLDINYIVYSVKTKEFTEYEPIGLETPLEGRAFYFGLQDCFHLVIDYYRRKLNINIPFPIDGNPFLTSAPDQWKHHSENRKDNTFLKEYLQKYGFSETNGLRKHDILVFRLGVVVAPCHLAIYLGGNRMLHHPYQSISEECNYDNFWKKRTCHILRHNLL